MFEWKVEDLKLLEETKRGGTFIGDERVFSCESKLTREEKIEFVDKLYDGEMSYFIQLYEKFEKEKEDLKKDQFGDIKTVSLKAWLKRNDLRNLIDNNYRTGEVRLGFFYNNRNIKSLNVKGMYDLYTDFVDEIFHKCLKECLKKEQIYFREHDEYSIKIQRINDYQKKYDTTFGVNEIWLSSDRIFLRQDKSERDLTEEEIDDMIFKYEQIDALIDKLTEETDIKF